MTGELLVRWAQLAPDDRKRGELLTAVVENVEARGWTFSTHTATVTRLADGDAAGRIVERGYGATVFTWSDGEPNSMGPAYSSLEPVETVAAALLGAYVAALEAGAAR